MPFRIGSFKPPRLRGIKKPEERPNAHQRGYCSNAHKQWRMAVLIRDAYQCQDCGKICDGKRDAHADHILPISQGGARYDLENGQTLCAACHARKTLKEQRDADSQPDQGTEARSGI